MSGDARSVPMNSGLNFLSVAAGGALGACARYAVSLSLSHHLLRFPWATLIANLSGALLAGFIATWFLHKGLLGTPVQLLLVVGFLGGFTTFSAFSIDTLRLLEAGNLSLAALNVGLNVGGSMIAVLIGAGMARIG